MPLPKMRSDFLLFFARALSVSMRCHWYVPIDSK